MTTHTTNNETERAFYVYTPADGNEDNSFDGGYTLSEAKQVARWHANNLREVGLDSAAYVNRIDNGNCEWSCA